ncbi:unnamed protein product [Malus baccata var. baccata]
MSTYLSPHYPLQRQRRHHHHHHQFVLPLSVTARTANPVHDAPMQTAPFEAIYGHTTARWSACKFPASPTAFEAFYGQKTDLRSRHLIPASRHFHSSIFESY